MARSLSTRGTASRSKMRPTRRCKASLSAEPETTRFRYFRYRIGSPAISSSCPHDVATLRLHRSLLPSLPHFAHTRTRTHTHTLSLTLVACYSLVHSHATVDTAAVTNRLTRRLATCSFQGHAFSCLVYSAFIAARRPSPHHASKLSNHIALVVRHIGLGPCP